ncbi:glycolate oxidase subunit, FAD-linked [Candidatus Sulfotelmatomonas gaucii]|uniref:Glycolate oxidase subunit, FAD-linked n=1 Tax=Candidatus Sulfuritelmatomonas gaucii TaxID=2043161 RepID=A0A2N9L2F2_9BACT|nr:glycolate oxidase subunit, FAD-linked [Candidatus Sulfotelmatomonas gaucii]
MLPHGQIDELRAAVGAGGLITAESQLQTYECDGLTNFRVLPGAVVLPQTIEQVQAVVRICARHKIPFVSRGAGTGLSGGALPAAGGVVISLARMNRILDVDIANRYVIVEPGVINAHVTQRVAADGYFYAPDPSSQSVCTIGGNVAENSGGAHCLKYGFTVTHTLALEVVLPSGELAHFGSPTLDAPGYDLAGVFVGSEGTLGIATKVTLRIVRRPEMVQTLLAAFPTPSAAGQTVSDIIAAGMLPAALEIMDTLAIEAAEAAVHAHYPKCGGLLLVELDGACDEVEILMREVRAIAEKNGAAEIRVAQSEAERALIWKGRKAAFAAVGRISPNYIVQDGVIPRTALPRVLADIERMSGAVNLRVANVFHAGDGNLHPLVLYDRSIEGQEEIALDLSYRILNLCVDNGGSITGEHGVGKEKQQALGYMFAEPDLETMQLVRCAFDPESLSNPDKVFPRPRLCADKPGPYTPHPLETAGVAEIF